MSFISTQKIRFDDVDGAGIVYYPRFFHFCHKAFEDFFNQGPFSYPELIGQRKIGFPTVHSEANFKKPIFYGEEIEVNLYIKKIGKTSMLNYYEFVNKNSRIIHFTTNITVVSMDLVEKTAVLIPRDIRDFLEAYL